MAENKLQMFNMPSNIKGMVLIYNNSYVLCEDSIRKIQTGTMVDIHNEYGKVPSSNIHIISNGANIGVITEIWQIMQKLEMLELNDKNRQNMKMRQYFCDIKKILLGIIEEISSLIDNYEHFYSDYKQELCKTTQPISKEIVTNHPFLLDLDKKVKDIIVGNIGGLLNKLAQLVVNVYLFELSNTQQNNIMNKDKYLNKAMDILKDKKIIQNNSALHQYINNKYIVFLSRLVQIRNKIEHPSRNQNVEIVNFYMQANGSYCVPYWNLNINEYRGSFVLIKELESTYLNILDFVENFIKLLINEKFNF